jgi:hypothetical protein
VNHVAEANAMAFQRAWKIPKTILGLRISALFFGQIRTARMEQPAAINQPEAQARFGFGQTVRNESLAQGIGNANPCRTRTQHDYLLITQAAIRSVHGRKYCTRRNGCRPLNVVIERDEFVAIAVQDGPRVSLRKILPL